MTNRLEVLSNLKRQVEAGVSVDLALSEAWNEGAASVLNPDGQRAAAPTAGATLNDLAGSLLQSWIAETFPGVLPKQGHVAEQSSSLDGVVQWASDNPALVPELARRFLAEGERLSFEEYEVVRLFSLLPVSCVRGIESCEVRNVGNPDFGRGVGAGYRMANVLERLNVALVPGGRRDG